MAVEVYGHIISEPRLASIVIIGLVVQYIVFIIFYRLFLHPLASIPGPKLAGVTFLVETYHNVIKDGTYYLRIAEWHKKYGPIVRITPDEVHFSDPSVYDKIYFVGSRYTKDPAFYLKFSGDHASIFTTPSNSAHRQRRSLLNPLFSKKAVTELEPLIKKHVDALCARVETSETVDMHRGLRCISLDAMSDYAFGRCFSLMSEPDFGAKVFERMRKMAPGIWAFRTMPRRLVKLITGLPSDIAKKIDEHAGALAMTREASLEYIIKIRDAPEDLPKTHKTMFHAMLYPAQKDIKPATAKECADEAITFTIAASETTGNAMEIALLGILANEKIHERLKWELKFAFPEGADEMTVVKLEKLQYLVACVKEGLRLSHGVIGRLPRVVQEPNVKFFGHLLPVGTVVSASNWFIHRNEKLFPDTSTFKPERWLGASGRSLEKYLCPFSKGSRQCIGINLAYSELYLTLANLIYRFDLKMSDDSVLKSVSDVEYVDYFANFQKDPAARLIVTKIESKRA